MSKIIAKNLLSSIEDDKNEETVISRLIELGRHQGYITSDDLYQLIPDAENDLDLLEEAFAAMLSAGMKPTRMLGENGTAIACIAMFG